MKTAKIQLSADPWETTAEGISQPKQVLRIPGLTQIGEGLFEIEGTKRREIDWERMSAAIRGEVSEMMADEISAAIFRVDILRVLADRVKLA